jgi:AraC-like DNA-binding protein
MQATYGKQLGMQPRFSFNALDVGTVRGPQQNGNSFSPEQATAKPSTNGLAKSDRGLIEALAQSPVYREYADAFTQATGLPLALRPTESWQLPLHGRRQESPYCALVAQKSRACAACLQVQEKLCQAAASESHTLVCSAGLCETAVPVHLGDRLVGFLQTGQVFRKKPTQAQFERMTAMLADKGVDLNRDEVEKAYFSTHVVSQKQQESAISLLRIFAQHLSMLSNQVCVQQENAEPPVITKAKAYIQEHFCEDLRLGEVAKACSTSTFYFCKIFKKAAGINFTDYLSRVRIEKAKNLLLNPNLRVSEIAFEVGFQSLTHFNRVFKRILGQSPTEYRAQLMGA